MSLADDIDDSSYYGGESDFRLSEAELLRRATELSREDSEIVEASFLADGSVHVRVKRVVPVLNFPALSGVAEVEIYGSSTAYLREYRSP